MIKITEFIMYISPYGILALVANMVGTLGTDVLAEVGRFYSCRLYRYNNCSRRSLSINHKISGS